MRSCRASCAQDRFALGVLTLFVWALAAPPARAANATVDVGGSAGLAFVPATVTINVGETVTWTNRGGTHDVLEDHGAFRCANGCDDTGGDGDVAGNLWSVTRTFNQAGTFGYHCQLHGVNGMRGTVVVQSGGGGGGGGGGGSQPGTIRFSTGSIAVSEGVGSATITVNRINGDDGAASVAWQSTAGTATAGSDFTAGSGTLSWADHDGANKTFQVPILNDTAVEGNETVHLALSNATGAALDNGHKSATLTILDNDAAGGPPPAPAHLTAAATSTSEITLGWDDVAGETGYLIERKMLGGTYQEIGAVGADVATFVAGGLDEATFYSFRVRTQNGSAVSPYSNEAGAAADTVPAPCVPSATTLCLNNNRFQVRAAWKFPNNSGDGHAVPLPAAPASGLFYFVDSTNIEMLIKVLNACSFSNPRYWVFYAATTNLEVKTTVVDTQTGKVKVYFNPYPTAAPPIQDVDAFATCP
jgi:plastocyanin